jgi:hypothetical protein
MSDLRRAARAVLELRQRREALALAKGEATTLTDADERDLAERVRRATSSTYIWLTEHTQTFNPHWVEQKRASPYEPFPKWPFWVPFFEYIESDEKVILVEKSRTMMISWALVGYFTLQAMLVPEREIVFQSMTEPKAFQLIEYAKCLWSRQPEWLREKFPLAKPVDKMAKDCFALKNGSVIWSISSGKGKIRSYHPWGFLNDESAFQPDAAEAFNDALPACVKIIFNSTAYPSWYCDQLLDATMEDL